MPSRSYPDAARAMNPPGAAASALGVARCVATVLLLVVSLVPLGLAALVPLRWRGERLAMWVPGLISRSFLAISGLRLDVRHAEALRDLRGFAFFNHVSHLDIPVLLAVRPFRFLATAGVKKIPVIGWMARAVGTVFVHRGNEESRAEARLHLHRAFRRSPTPIALAPEGGVNPDADLRPFRHGAFEVARDAQAPVLLVALEFEPRGPAGWLEGESLLHAYWRLAARTEPTVAHVVALPPPRPVTGPPAEASDAAEVRIRSALAALRAR